MPKITLVTGHVWDSKRKAGFHHLAKAYQQLGYEVLFFTAPVSFLHKLKKDHIFQYNILHEKNGLVEKEDNILSYIHFTPWHLANTKIKILNFFTSPLARLYSLFFIDPAAIQFVKESIYIIFESTPGLLLFDKFRALNKKAKFVYRVSDDLRLLKVHPALIRYERQIIKRFDLVSIVSKHFFSIFEYGNIRLHYHGIDKNLFDSNYPNPYKGGDSTNVIFIGNAHFDKSFINISSEMFPEFTFHIIGPIKGIQEKDNVIIYGEMPFLKTIPFIKYANIGLHTLEYLPGVESFTDTLKVQQYTYCKLPIIAPTYLKNDRKHVFYYRSANSESIRHVLEKASAYPHDQIDNTSVIDWKELAQILIKAG